jgi:hypothetical protein
MAAPLSKEIKTKIIEYLTTQDLSDLSGRKIVQLIETNVGVRISQPTALTLKYEAEDELAEEMSIERPPIGFDRLRESCREFFSDEGIDILYEMARMGSNREKLEALKLIIQYGYGRPNNRPDLFTSIRVKIGDKEQGGPFDRANRR